MSSLLTTIFILDEVKSIFGDPILEVEAISASLSKSIDHCLRVYNRYKPKVVTYSTPSITTSVDTVAYVDLPLAIGIKKVDFVSTTTSASSADPFSLYISMLKSGGNVSPGQFQLDVYMERLDRYRILERVFATKDDWHWLEEERRLIFYCPNGPKNIKVEYFAEHKEVVNIPSYDDQLILDMVIAQMKMKVGEIRRKYGGSLPSPGGATIQLDGPELRDEGKEEWDIIMESFELLKIDIGISQT